MAFKGLFVGIDRYSSPHINWLSCAARDARALHAAFTDMFGAGGTILTDEQATKTAIEAELDRLAQSAPDDFVILSFSGHGTPTHQLVAYDTDVANLTATTISLDELANRFAKIPSNRMVCFLDCCFSGGMGAKVLRSEAEPRDVKSAEDALQKLSGNGRIILTASTATQPAWENARFGHGFLTWFVLEALFGAREVVHGGKIAVYLFLQHVTKRVTDEAARIGKPQHPTVRGQVDGEFSWPIFTPGDLYRAAFPERSRAPASADISSLLAYGFPPALLKVWSTNIPSLNELQVQAINEFRLMDGENLLVSAPTSSGKTMIGELAALRGAVDRKRTIFLLPLRALVNDKHFYFSRAYGQFGIRTIRATGEITDDIPDLMRGRFDICLMTYEKFGAMALGSPHILEQVSTIVVDEVQMITDPTRGLNLEFVLTLIRMRRNIGVVPQVIALSAVIGDTFGFERWLGGRLLRSNHRPVPLDEGVLNTDGTFRYLESGKDERHLVSFIHPEYRKGSSQDHIIPLVRKLVNDGKQAIVFRETKGEARGCATYLAESLGLPPARDALNALPAGDRSQASNALRETLNAGVAFHNADLDRDERLVIEQEFRKPGSKIRVIAATTTLAMGINTPAEAIIIAGLEHPGPTPTPYSVAEYKNMVGRAGRLGFATHGQSFIITTSPAEEYQVWEQYVKGKPEDLFSHFLSSGTDPRSLLLRVLAATQQRNGVGMTAEELIEFLHGSFGAFLQRDQNSKWEWDRPATESALADLIEHNLVTRSSTGQVQLTALGRLSGEAGVEVETIIRLVRILRDIPSEQITDPTLIAAAQITIEVDGVLFPINKKSTQKEPQHWQSELQRQNVPSRIMSALEAWTTEKYHATLRAKKAVACLYWISDTPMEEIERAVTQFGGAFGGAAGPIRAIANRTSDLLETVCRVAELTHDGLNLSDRRARLLTRLQVGVSGKNVEIAEIFGNNLARGDYRNLAKAGMNSIKSIASATDEQIKSAVGGADSGRKLDLIKTLLANRQNITNLGVPVVPVPTYEP